MGISFNVKQAREQLLGHGIVYTYRWNRRRFFELEKGTQEHTWANSGRGTTKIANVIIEEVAQFDGTEPDLLKPYYEQSGFWNAAEWCCVITEMGLRATSPGWLYKVMIVGAEQ